MNHTINYSLKKPDLTDKVNIDDFNTNADIIDDEIKKLNNLLTTNVSNLNTQLNTKIDKFINFYNSALQDINNDLVLFRNLRSVYLKNGKIKIAIIGDSITEGADNCSTDVYINKLINKLTKIYGNQIEFFNFALSGRATWQFNRDDYIALENESNIVQHFSRPWSTVGKSWKTHVIDYKPDLVIIAFGMNGVNASNPQNSGMDNYKWLNEAINNLKSALPYVEFALVSNFMPTENKNVYNQDDIGTMQIARMTNEYAKNNNIPLVNAYRLDRILRKGIDENSYNTHRYTSINDILDKKVYNLEMYFSFKSNVYTKLSFRADRGNDISFELNEQGNILVKANGELLHNLNNQSKNKIILDGSKINLNDNIIYSYNTLQEGLISIYNSENITNFDCFINYFQNGLGSYTEEEILNRSSSGIGGGNGINHPTPLGHELIYYSACGTLINSITNSLNENYNLLYIKNENNELVKFTDSASGKEIYYNTLKFAVNKDWLFEVYNTKLNLTYKRRFDLSYQNINQLRDDEFCIFFSNSDNNKSQANMFIPGFENWSDANTSNIIVKIKN